MLCFHNVFIRQPCKSPDLEESPRLLGCGAIAVLCQRFMHDAAFSVLCGMFLLVSDNDLQQP